MGRDSNPAGWGFGVTIGVVLAVLLVCGIVAIMFIAICGGGCAMVVGGMGAAINEAEKNRRENQPPVSVTPQPITEVAPPPKAVKLELLGSDKAANPPIYRVRIWEDIPTEENMTKAVERLRGEELRRIYIYSVDQDDTDEPFAEFEVDVNDTRRVR